MEESPIHLNQDQQCDENKKDQIEISSQITSKKINKTIEQLTEYSANTRNNLSITQKINILRDLLDELDHVKQVITDSQSQLLYILLSKFIKIKPSNIQDDPISSPSELKEEHQLKIMKNKVIEMMESALILSKQIFKEPQKHILWMDSKQSNNQKELFILQNIYENNVTIKYFSNGEEFRANLEQVEDHPLILIMSASAAGSNSQYGDGDHLNYALSIKNTLRLRGIIIFCGKNGMKSMKELQSNPDNMIYSVVTERNDLYEKVERLIVPLDFKRVVPLSHLDYYFCKSMKEGVLKWSSEDWSQQNLLDYKIKKFERMFSNANEFIEEKKVNILKQVKDQMGAIPPLIREIFKENDTEEKLCCKFINFYSSQKNPCFQFLNSVLSIMNEDLIFILFDFISIFLISLYKFNDSLVTAIQKTESGINPKDLPSHELFRGTSIPTNFLNNNQFIEGQFITLPSFSSFTAQLNVAKKFMFLQNKFGDCTYLLLSYKFQTGTKYYDSRPKNIKQVSNFKYEEEYLVYPFTTFCIISVEKKEEEGVDYLHVELSVN